MTPDTAPTGAPTPSRLQRRNGLTTTKPLQRRTGLRARSPKRERQFRTYRPMVAKFLKEHPYCEFPLGCIAPSVDVQHTNGREGERLLDTRYWKASCRYHNDWAETHTGEALAIGWLLRIESVDSLVLLRGGRYVPVTGPGGDAA